MQNELKDGGELLNSQGALNEAGYSKSLIKSYSRDKIKGGALRIKEWDYYIVMNERFALALTIDDNSYMGLDSISFLDFESKFQQIASPMQFMTLGKKMLPSTSVKGDIVSQNKGYFIKFINKGDSRELSCHMDNFFEGKPIDAFVKLDNPHQDSIVMHTPFSEKKTAFYYNQKINCMPAEGYVEFDDKKYIFEPSSSFGTLDWGRGVWTYNNTWYWGSASGVVGEKRFGFNIGYGFGDTSKASENILFYDGAAHKLSKVKFNIPTDNGKEAFIKPWTFSSDDGRFEMDFVPILDRASNTDVLIIKSDQHQVFGKFSGKATLDDSTVLEIKNLTGFAEKVINRW